MKIILTPDVLTQLTAWKIMSNGREFSGLGLVERTGEDLTIVGVDLLAVGSTGFTEFTGERQRQLPLDPRRKLWFHRHPIGNGIPGPPNWSGTDEHTCTKEPFGVDPQLVQWSVSIVFTPSGWVGRVDFYVPKLRTFHCAVEPNLPTPEIIEAAQALCTPELKAEMKAMLNEYHALYPQYRVPQSYRASDFDIIEDFEPSGMFCHDCGIECSLEGQEDIAGLADATIAVCPNCGQFFMVIDAHSATIVDPDKQLSQPGWTQSFMNFWAKKGY